MMPRGLTLLLSVVACAPSAPAPHSDATAVKQAATRPTTPAAPHTDATAGKQAATGPTTPAAPQVAARMTDHFRDAVKIKDAVIDGDLPEVRAPARRLMDDADHVPETWLPFVSANANYAAVLLAAKDRHTAGVAAAGLARTCGDCHAALGVGPAFAPPHDIPASSPHDVLQHMHRHQWAADRMWEALIDRSEYAWMAGAAALVDASLPRADLTQDIELPDDALELGRRLHEIGALAGTTVGWSARGGLYGELLGTCAGCHKGGC